MARLKLADSIIKMLKDDLVGEYEAVDQYQEHIDVIDIPEVKELLTHIMEEEKHHIQELEEIIKKYSR